MMVAPLAVVTSEAWEGRLAGYPMGRDRKDFQGNEVREDENDLQCM